MKYIHILLFACASLTLQTQAVWAENDEVVVYSARKEHLIKPLFDRYTQATGVPVRYITDKAGPLLQRLHSEGKFTHADMLMTVDAGNLWQAAEQGVLATIASESLEKNIPVHLVDPNKRWFGLSVRARTIVYSSKRVNVTDLDTYESLADPKWQGRLCLRTSKKVYNQSLVALMMARLGEKKTESIVKGWVNNLAAPVFSNDTRLMKAIVSGQCDVGIVNSYYFGRLQKKDAQVPLKLFWPNQSGTAGGVHVNISGAGITRHAKNPESAQKLLEWLSSATAQKQFADLNLEYPVNDVVAPHDLVKAWGEFKPDELNISEAGRWQARAVMLMDRAGYH
jgi:iron(III) transport system substrate-binding protein